MVYLLLRSVKYVYKLDGTKILRETWANNTLVPLYDNEDSVCGIIYNGTPYYFLKNLQGDVISITDADGTAIANYTYDAAGNITDAPDSCFQYDTNNRLVVFNGHAVTYDLDGNMLNNGKQSFTYDSANRLITADGHTYTYNAEDVRIRNLCTEEDTTYTYNTNAKLSMLLMKTTDGVVTKYVYGKGLIGEAVGSTFKTYHFDSRGSTIAITDACGNITDTFAYDTYGKMIEHCGNSAIIFGYNGRDGVVTDYNGLVYMRARYYSPAMKRFINADIIAGAISNAITLNRYAYANGNPVSFIDPFGLSADSRGSNAKTTISCNQAVLVTRFDHEGLKVVGHTQLYFNCDGKWYLAEFTSRKGSTLKQIKGNAKVYWQECTPPVLNDSGQFQDVEGSNYVVLNGDFKESVKLAKQYAGQDPNDDNKEFGRYNFLFHNCADYTNELLDVANIDGMSSQILSEGITFPSNPISIPVLREIELSVSDAIDSGIEWASDGLVDLGNSMIGSNLVGDVVGTALVGTGNFIDGATNFVGDAIDVVTGVAGEFVDVGKNIAAGVTNTIVDAGTALYEGGKYLWNKLFG